ncbi:MAG: 2-oxo acid dehydrogenase subunit E2 [Dehalococcoidia bacterium]|nr:MAG: 2-oxo acid dehydrogenase subunit E2 [Dehalococcoidia bacterium]
MASTTTLNMPDVGESVTEGTVTRWIKHEGDAVELDDPVVEIETEKVTVEVPSPFEGRLAHILVQEGEVVPIGAPLAEFDVGAEAAPTANNKQQTAKEPASASRANGAQTPPTPRVGAQPAAPTPAVAPALVATATPAPRGDGATSPAGEMRRTRQHSPVVLKLAAEHGIDLSLVLGTGIDGRVTRQDVMRYLENPAAYTVSPAAGEGVVGVAAKTAPMPRVGAQPAAPAAAAPPAPAARAAGPDDEVVPLSPTRRTIAARMLDAHQSMPVAWMVVEADVTGLVRLREANKERFQATEGVPLTYLPFLVQAITGALKEHPALNATYTDDGIIVHHRRHIGVAVATDAGLIVPVVRDADDRSVAGLAREIVGLGARARDRKLGLDDVRGATFTVDNTGAFGSIMSQPIIPPGTAAIITTEAIRRELRVAADGSFAARDVMNLCISFDHRALDGAQAGAFMQTVRHNIEAFQPSQAVY